MDCEENDIVIREISSYDAEEIFLEHMKRDFPPEELKPFSRMEEMRKEGIYAYYGIYADDALSGYAFLVKDNKGGMLLDYFAVFESLRGSGIGSRFLKAFPKVCGPMSYMIIEVEDPGYASDDEDLSLRGRRIHFYEKAGVYMTGVRTSVYDADYAIMLYTPGTVFNDADAEDAVRHMYRMMFSEEVYRTKVKIGAEV